MTGFAASTVNISGGLAGELLDLSGNVLNAATSTVDASAFKGVLTASANTDTATTFTAKTTVGTLTGGVQTDTFTISDSLDASVGSIVGGNGVGVDVLNAKAKGSSFTLTDVTQVETINVAIDAADAFNMTVAVLTVSIMPLPSPSPVKQTVRSTVTTHLTMAPRSLMPHNCLVP